eukprot:4293846-Pyramimonas_sp.AAC.1
MLLVCMRGADEVLIGRTCCLKCEINARRWRGSQSLHVDRRRRSEQGGSARGQGRSSEGAKRVSVKCSEPHEPQNREPQK